jgi:hypothetical protein
LSVIIRRNVGYDFAAWRDALAVTALPKAETRLLVLVNDSMYGPFTPLKAVFDRFDFSKADIWGLTDSWQHRFHLQSYFLAFGPRALAHDSFSAFWRSVLNVRSKWAVIRHYEIGLANFFMRAGLRCKAAWPYVGLVEGVRQTYRTTAEKEEDATADRDPYLGIAEEAEARILRAAARRVPMNPTNELWRQLIAMRFPFL